MSTQGDFFKLLAGFEAARASREEARAVKQQGALAAEESEVEAQRVEAEGGRFQARQKLAFLKSGVSLEGSPLLTLQETGEETKAQAGAIRRRGGAQFRLSRKRAKVARGRGRAALFSGAAETQGVEEQLKGGR